MKKDKSNHRNIEILAPAGSYESFMAAIRAGADAVYAGGPYFGARAFADNFTVEKLLEAIDYAHLHGRKFYLTVNTLLKDHEMSRLYEYLLPLYRQGLDAVIVQDVGVLDFVRSHFPEMDIHASTQMTITNLKGAKFLEEQGVERVVPARELNLKEIAQIAKGTNLEIECFVHGALCYCYSGQCLLSSLIGGRSGNRGQCAQPCRLPYTVEKKTAYFMSPKDICTLDYIPEMIEAGITSFKIEGRMKKPEYVAAVTSLYKKYTDLYFEKGRENYKVSAEDVEKLMDVYNRGGFSKGYYHQQNGKDMISLNRPNHAGVAALKVISQNGREVTASVLTDIHKGDILEIAKKKEYSDGKENYTFGKEYTKGQKATILVPRGYMYTKGMILHRIRNQELLGTIQEQYGSGLVQEPITGYFQAMVGKPAVLTLNKNEVSVSVCTQDPVEEAQNQPLDPERLRKQLNKTGNAEFRFESLEISVEGNIFLPMQKLNELRRTAMEELEKKICVSYRREEKECKEEVQIDLQSRQSKKSQLTVLVETNEQFSAVLESKIISRVYVDANYSHDLFNDVELQNKCAKCHQNGIEIFLAMPHIFRENAVQYYEQNYEKFLKLKFDGVLVRNYESVQFLKQKNYEKEILPDYNLYIFNQSAKEFWRNIGMSKFTAPLELNKRELERLGIKEAELLLYGRIPLMISAQCIQKTSEGCSKVPRTLWMKDRLKKQLPVKNFCKFCYNIIYDSEVLWIGDLKQQIKEISPMSFRCQFTTETAVQVADILHVCETVLFKDRILEKLEVPYHHGHFDRGIS